MHASTSQTTMPIHDSQSQAAHPEARTTACKSTDNHVGENAEKQNLCKFDTLTTVPDTTKNGLDTTTVLEPEQEPRLDNHPSYTLHEQRRKILISSMDFPGECCFVEQKENPDGIVMRNIKRHYNRVMGRGIADDMDRYMTVWKNLV